MTDTDKFFQSKQERHQFIRLRRTMMALVGAFFHTIICALLLYNGYFRMDLNSFIILFSIFWCIHLIFPLMILLNINLKFKDPSMTFSQVIWAIICVMITIYFTDKMRSILMLFLLLDIIFGSFQLERKQFILLIVTVVIGYLITISLIEYYHPTEASFSEENIVFSSLILVSLFIGFLSYELGSLRKHLTKKAQSLSSNLEVIENISYTDDLTGIKNRRFALGFLEQQRWYVERQKDYVFSIAIFDVDQFKKINDNFGHETGDRVLKKLTKVISDELRKSDLFARYGGDEFLLILPFINLEQMKIAMKRILEVVNKKITEIIEDISISISIGYTQYRWPEDIEETIKRADKALYLAKGKGGNTLAEL